MKMKGIDVSTFQGAINWSRVKTSGIEFAMLRGGYGRSVIDDRFIQNYNACKNTGIPVGVYHYSYAITSARAKEEANFVISYLKGKQFEFPIAFDIEDKTQINLSKRTLTSICKTFCDTLENAGYYVVIYSSKSFLLNKLDLTKLSKYDIWVAQWNEKCDFPYPYGMWQFSDAGRMAGITGNVDLDYAFKNYPSIIKKAGLNGFRKTGSTSDVLVKGQKVKLNHALIYTSSTTTKSNCCLNGTYYLYDGVNSKGRYRITNSLINCGRMPMSLYVTGWVNKKDIIV